MTHHLTVKEKFPEESRPRERLLKHGAKNLADHELLAILLKTGTRQLNAVDLALHILLNVGDLYGLKQASLEDLIQLPGIGQVKALEILALCELGQRLSKAQQAKFGQISSSRQAGQYFQDHMQGLHQEHVVVAYLNTKNEIIRRETVFLGTLSSAISHPREIFRGAVRYSAARIVIAHNHPSGHLEPSKADLNFTQRLVECGEMIGIEVLDHFIVTDHSYLSLREEGWI